MKKIIGGLLVIIGGYTLYGDHSGSPSTWYAGYAIFFGVVFLCMGRYKATLGNVMGWLCMIFTMLYAVNNHTEDQIKYIIIGVMAACALWGILPKPSNDDWDDDEEWDD